MEKVVVQADDEDEIGTERPVCGDNITGGAHAPFSSTRKKRFHFPCSRSITVPFLKNDFKKQGTEGEQIRCWRFVTARRRAVRLLSLLMCFEQVADGTPHQPFNRHVLCLQIVRYVGYLLHAKTKLGQISGYVTD